MIGTKTENDDDEIAQNLLKNSQIGPTQKRCPMHTTTTKAADRHQIAVFMRHSQLPLEKFERPRQAIQFC